MAATAKLPGVYFSVEPRRVPDVLPRMDVAAFVGFAASGPLHTPVPVEDVGRFRDIFGREVPLAWDEARGEMETSWLAQSVDAFFRQGGQRCWIVRVADESAAVTTPLEIPGVWPAAATPNAPNLGAAALARSPGWWATELRVGTRLRRERYAPAGNAVTWDGSVWTADFALSPLDLAPGDLLELVFPNEQLLFFLFVDRTESIVSDLDPRSGFERVTGARGFWYRASLSSPAVDIPLGADHPALESLPGADLAAIQTIAQSGGSPGLAAESAFRVTFDLLSWRGSAIELRMDRLGFAPSHPRYWANLPTDVLLFELPRGRRAPARSPEEEAFRHEAASPRFPIAGPQVGPPLFYLPLGMAVIEDAAAAWTPDTPSISRLVYDGLEEFSDALFFDPRLAQSYIRGLLAEAENRHYEEAVTLPAGQPLRGAHSLLPVHEVSMMSVPDATHRGWTQAPPEPPPQLAAPDLLPIPALDSLGRVAVSFTGPAEADSFRLEIARTRCFRSPDTVEKIAAQDPVPAAYEHFFVPQVDCPTVFRFRVRSERLGEVSPWSRTRSAVFPARHFEKCGEYPPGAAALILQALPASPPPGSLLLWDYEDPNDSLPGDSFEVQLAYEPGFSSPEKITSSDPNLDEFLRRYEPPSRSDKTRYYRVRTVRQGFKGDWSNTVVLEPTNRTDWTSLPEAEFDDDALLAIHRLLLRFCAARADSVALLTLPRHYREFEAGEHLGLLLPRVASDREPALSTGVLRVPALTIGEEQEGATSYAACYHPWTAVALPLEEGGRGERLRIVYVPPDGFAAGSIASKTIQSGAWISPANQPLAGIAALDPKFDLEQWGRLTGMQVNLALEQPRGFLYLNSETLSASEEVRELNVRRLMILLRRLALREGETFVFEPNSGDFRALVRQRFERWMSDLYVRGAFQGRTPDAAFRVVVDESVNPPLAIEQGRFLVELRVAPSRPFRFLNVRLLQTAPERLTVNEV